MTNGCLTCPACGAQFSDEAAFARVAECLEQEAIDLERNVNIAKYKLRVLRRVHYLDEPERSAIVKAITGKEAP